MSSRPFDRVVFNRLESLLSEDLLRIGGEGDAGLRGLLREVGVPASDVTNPTPTALAFGFYGASFMVVSKSPASGSVRILPGMGMKRDDSDMPQDIGGIVGLNEISDLKPIVLRAPVDVATAPPPAAPDKRIDIIEVAMRRDLYDSLPRDILDPVSAKLSPSNMLTTLSYALDGISVGYVTTPSNSTQPIGYKVGAPGSPPVAPATSPGYQKIAEILVDNVTGNPTGTIRQEHLADFRNLLFMGGVGHFGLTAQFKSTVPDPPIIEQAPLPPGIRLAVFNNQALVQGSAHVYLLNNINQATFVSDSRLPRVPPAFEIPRVSVTKTVVDSTIQGNIGGPATTPAQKVPLGHPVIDIFVRIHKWDSGGPDFVSDDFADAGFNLIGNIT